MNCLNRRELLSRIAWGTSAAAVGLSGAQKRPPNFVFILIDDLGWKDLSCYGSRFFETPNIDGLASKGMRFTNAYAAAPLCSPTRASIMTGKYPARVHITMALPGPSRRPSQRLFDAPLEPGLPLREVTIAEELKAAGYTSAAIGKWHLGGEGMHPEDQGFDLNVGGSHVGMPPDFFYPYWAERGRSRLYPKMQNVVPLDGQPGDYLTDRLTDEALKFMEGNRQKPFLLYLAHYAVHIPIQGKEEITAKYRAKAKADDPQNNAEYAAMIESVDQSVGRVLGKLDDLGLADNTVIFFMSDNGGLAHKEGPRTPATSNAPLREGKHFLYEGGIREPMIIRWPSVTKPGSVCDEPVTSTDFYPTMAEMAGVRKLIGNPVDGVSLTPLLKGGHKLGRQAIYWHYPHNASHGAKPGSAVRIGNYKLLEFFDPPGVELYNLAQDIGETKDLAAKEPGRVAEMRKMLERWRASVGAGMMTPNPDYRPASQ